MKNKGFTLIELLIVIALLGALAVGLLAAVDPFEQLKKGSDTSTRNTVSEFYNASIRFYSSANRFPYPWWTAGEISAKVGGMTAELSEIITAGELKEKFVELATSARLNKIYVTSTADAQGYYSSIAVCFMPESKSFQKDSNTMFDAQGITGTDCKSAGGATDCYWCVQ